MEGNYMKKFLVLFLVLAVSAGLFAGSGGQELYIDSKSNRLVNTKAKYTEGLVSLDKIPIINRRFG